MTVTPSPLADAAQQARLAIALCDRLGMAGALVASRRLLKRSEELGEAVRRGQVDARQQRDQFLRELVTGTGPIDPDQLHQMLQATGPWLNYRPGDTDTSPAITVVMEAARAARGQAAAAAQAESTALHRKLQLEAAGVVEATKQAGKLPGKVWTAPDPVHEAMVAGREDVWAKLSRAQDRFGLVHQLAGVLRSMGAFGASVLLPDGAPAWGFAYRQWAKALEGEQELKRLHPALRLRYAVDHGWEPGLWLAGDLVMPPPTSARRGLLGFLVPSPLRDGAGASVG